MRKSLQTVLFILFLGSVGLISCKDKPQTEEEFMAQYDTVEEKETDPMMTMYKDSLKKYFGSLEIDLIRQYKVNHESLSTEQDFYTFYRNANTLKRSLTRSLNKVAAFRVATQKPLPSFEWFEELAKGFQVYIVNEGRSYVIYFDYQDLKEHAQQTEGQHDDEFVDILERSYDSETHQNKWNILTGDNSYCSKLGGGKHYEILKQVNTVLSHSRIFYKEIHKIQVAIINDMLFSPMYCYPPEDIKKELQQIIDEIEFKGKEAELLQVRIEQVDNPEKNKIKFNCLIEDCIPKKVRETES